MKSIYKLAAAAPIALLAACNATMPTTPVANDDPQTSSPRPVATRAVEEPKPVTPPAKPSVSWNVESCNKSQTALGTASSALTGADKACVIIDVAAKANKGTKGTPPATQIYTAQLHLPACESATSTGIAATVGNLFGKVGNLATGAVTKVTGGAGAAGHVATNAARTEAGKTANSTTATLSAEEKACNAQLVELANGDLAAGVKKLTTEWKQDYKGYSPVLTIKTELPPGQQATVVNALTPR